MLRFVRTCSQKLLENCCYPDIINYFKLTSLDFTVWRIDELFYRVESSYRICYLRLWCYFRKHYLLKWISIPICTVLLKHVKLQTYTVDSHHDLSYSFLIFSYTVSQSLHILLSSLTRQVIVGDSLSVLMIWLFRSVTIYSETVLILASKWKLFHFWRVGIYLSKM